jgi:tRNA threonylcarbamoyl adenosine modification protein YjeE
LPDEAATQRLGQSLAPALQPGMVIFLEGDLGAGKTTLVRALIRALGHPGPVKSPTYSLVEVYVISSLYLYHFDFYRFESPEEFLDAGLDEYFNDNAPSAWSNGRGALKAAFPSQTCGCAFIMQVSGVSSKPWQIHRRGAMHKRPSTQRRAAAAPALCRRLADPLRFAAGRRRGEAAVGAVGAHLAGRRLHPGHARTRRPLKFTHFTVENPDRLVVDIEGVEFNSVLDSLARKVTTDDPYIKLLRAGRYKPGVVRLVMELKSKVTPQVFEVKPVGEYGHRLVLDVYPLTPVDPLMSLVEGRKDAVEPLQLDPEPKPQEAPTKKAEPASRRRKRRKSGPRASRASRSSTAWSPSPSIPGMAAKILAPSAAAGPTKRTSRWRSPGASRRVSMPSRTCAPC